MKWATRSVDMNCLDLFLEGYLNDRVFKNHPYTSHGLKQCIRAEE